MRTTAVPVPSSTVNVASPRVPTRPPMRTVSPTCVARDEMTAYEAPVSGWLLAVPGPGGRSAPAELMPLPARKVLVATDEPGRGLPDAGGGKVAPAPPRVMSAPLL